MNPEATALEIEQATRAAQIVQQMPVDVKQIGILAHVSDDMLVPNFGQQRTTGLFQWPVLRLASLAGGIKPLSAFLRGLCSGLRLTVSKHSRSRFG
jgi:hypothetical protein